MRVTIALSAAAGFFVSSHPSPVAGQAFRLISSRPTAESPYEFTQISEIHELRDGRVLVLDRLVREVRVVDFNSGSAPVLGRAGDGPREYRAPLDLVPLGGDSAGIYDDANVRILVVRASGELGEFVTPFSHAEGTRLGGTVGDGRGFIYAQQRSRSTEDSASIFRWHAGAPVAEFVLRMHVPPPAGAVSLGAGIVKPGTIAQPSTRNIWAVHVDGTLAVVGFDPYQVILAPRSGQPTVGPTIPYTRVTVNDSVKRAFLNDRPKGRTGLILDRTGKTTAVSEPAFRIEASDVSWAPEVPPFRGDAFVAFDPTGMLWIQRTTFGREGARYDIVGRDGKLADRVRLPEGHRVIGFGRSEMYVIRRDADDLEFLQRHQLPKK